MSPGRGGTFANRLSRRSKCWPRRTSRLSMPESSGEIPAYLHAVKRECPPRRDVSYLYCHQPRPDVRRSASGHLGRTRCSVKELMVLWTKRRKKSGRLAGRYLLTCAAPPGPRVVSGGSGQVRRCRQVFVRALRTGRCAQCVSSSII